MSWIKGGWYIITGIILTFRWWNLMCVDWNQIIRIEIILPHRYWRRAGICWRLTWWRYYSILNRLISTLRSWISILRNALRWKRVLLATSSLSIYIILSILITWPKGILISILIWWSIWKAVGIVILSWLSLFNKSISILAQRRSITKSSILS